VGSDLVQVGRVGKPHGLDGGFFVEGASQRRQVFAMGATLYAGGEPATVVASRHGSGGRQVILLDRTVERGAELAVARSTLPSLTDEDEFYVFQLVGLSVEEEGGSHRVRIRVPKPLHRFVVMFIHLGQDWLEVRRIGSGRPRNRTNGRCSGHRGL